MSGWGRLSQHLLHPWSLQAALASFNILNDPPARHTQTPSPHHPSLAKTSIIQVQCYAKVSVSQLLYLTFGFSLNGGTHPPCLLLASLFQKCALDLNILSPRSQVTKYNITRAGEQGQCEKQSQSVSLSTTGEGER